jgi:hypothetical protein
MPFVEVDKYVAQIFVTSPVCFLPIARAEIESRILLSSGIESTRFHIFSNCSFADLIKSGFVLGLGMAYTPFNQVGQKITEKFSHHTPSAL